jgi:hypothetical protein
MGAFLLWHIAGIEFHPQWAVYFQKLQRILADGAFSQHAKLNMASFVLCLLHHFGLRCRMVELHPKARKEEAFNIQPSTNTNSKGKTIFTVEDAEGRKAESGLVGIKSRQTGMRWDAPGGGGHRSGDRDIG